MKNKGLIITLIVLLSIITILLIVFLAMSISDKISLNIFSLGWNSKSTKVIYNEEFELENIKNIEIVQDAGDTIIREAEGDYIQVVLYGEYEEDAKVNLENGNLYVENTHNKKNNITFFGFGTNKKNDIIIYLPSDYANIINIKNNYGECEIIDLENATVNIDCDAGDIELGKIKNANIKCAAGNVEIEEITNKCNIEVNCGNLEINTISIKEDSNIEVNMGNIEINNTNDIYIDAEVDFGSNKIDMNNRNAEITLKIECDCGNVTVKN